MGLCVNFIISDLILSYTDDYLGSYFLVCPFDKLYFARNVYILLTPSNILI